MDLKVVLRDNVVALCEHQWGKVNKMRLAAGAGTGYGTIQRVLAADTAIGLDVISRIAEVLGVDAWQLLCPGLDPSAGRIRSTYEMSPRARALGDTLDAIKNPTLAATGYSLAMQRLEFSLDSDKQLDAMPAAPTAPAHA